MKKVLLGFFTLFFLFSICPLLFSHAHAQTPQVSKDTFFTATVLSISHARKTITARLANGKTVAVTYEPQSSGVVHLHEAIVVGKTVQVGSGVVTYYFVDAYRFAPLLFAIGGFFILILLIAGWKGIGSILGLVISLGVIFFFIVPQILSGGDPLTVCTIGAVGILFVTTFVAHGISQQTVTALAGTLVALCITFFLAQFVAQLVLLTGYGNEDAVNLQFALPHMVNLRGLYLGGIMLATLGALNDITITQAASIFSLRRANPSMSFKELALEGYGIGREHALSLVNTLLLAFAGASLAVFIFIVANPTGQPLWVMLNSEFFIEEIMKIIAGTAGLLLSVPLVTLLAALMCDRGVRDYLRALIH